MPTDKGTAPAQSRTQPHQTGCPVCHPKALVVLSRRAIRPSRPSNTAASAIMAITATHLSSSAKRKPVRPDTRPPIVSRVRQQPAKTYNSENGFFRLCIFLTATSVDRVFRLVQLSGYLIFEDLAARLAFWRRLKIGNHCLTCDGSLARIDKRIKRWNPDINPASKSDYAKYLTC